MFAQLLKFCRFFVGHNEYKIVFSSFVSLMGFSAGGSLVPEVTWNLAFFNGIHISI